MADRISKAARSENMRRIGSRDTGPEKFVRSLLHREGYRFRLHWKDLPGKPDIFLPKHRLAIFIHGCFWHGHPNCKRAKIPKTRVEFWRSKISKNRERDQRVLADLHLAGYRTLVFWGCELKDTDRILRNIAEAIDSG